MDTTFTTLGLRAATALGITSGMVTTLRGTLGWRHAFGDVTSEMQNAFATGGAAFTVAGVPIAKDALLLEAGLDFDVTSNAKFSITYSGQFAGNAQEQGGKANLLVRF